jgi:DNA-binding beta-propeller fold protein YncE
MLMRTLRSRLAVSALMVVSGLVAAQPASAEPTAKVTTVASGLDNPRDLAFGPGDKLYVAEAGHGGSECVPGGEMGTQCFGFTSGISRVLPDKHSTERVASDLASVADPKGMGATGLDGISVLPDGTIYGIMTEASATVPSTGLSEATSAKLKAQFGRLFRLSPGGHLERAANVGDEDFAWADEHKSLVPAQFPEANPYGVFATPDAQWVVDAASNTIDKVQPNGEVTVEQFIPNPAFSDAVPTCIDRGPDGAFYIGELTGAGNPPGSSRVWRYAPWESKPLTQWASGLTAVTGCGFSEDGNFFATELSTAGFENAAPGTGAVVSVKAHSKSPETVVSGLNFPGGFASGEDALYVSNWSTAPAENHGGPTGEVVKISAD